MIRGPVAIRIFRSTVFIGFIFIQNTIAIRVDILEVGDVISIGVAGAFILVADAVAIGVDIVVVWSAVVVGVFRIIRVATNFDIVGNAVIVYVIIETNGNVINVPPILSTIVIGVHQEPESNVLVGPNDRRAGDELFYSPSVG